jgi:hypothetical protein
MDMSVKDSQRMVGALCESSKLGPVSQRDLGSADKWHKRCYVNRQARVVERQFYTADGRHHEYGVTCEKCKLEPMMGLTWSGARDMAMAHNAVHHLDD